MVKALFWEKDGRIGLRVEGHAGHSSKGTDIVCSACSILVYTVAAIVESERTGEAFVSEPVVSFSDGVATVVCRPTKKRHREFLQTFSVALVGFELLEKNYPENVKLTNAMPDDQNEQKTV